MTTPARTPESTEIIAFQIMKKFSDDRFKKSLPYLIKQALDAERQAKEEAEKKLVESAKKNLILLEELQEKSAEVERLKSMSITELVSEHRNLFEYVKQMEDEIKSLKEPK